MDEAGMAYDAWCLANYGVDRYLKPFPVYLTNYGGGQSAMYAWLAAGLIALTDSASALVLRLPAAAFGLLTVVFGALIVREIMGKEHPWAWLVFGLFCLACPYFTMASRFGLDCNLMLGMSTVFLYALIRAVKGGRPLWYALAGAAGGLTLYTYALSYLTAVLFVLFLLVWLVRMRRLRWRNAVAAAVPLALIAWPLVAVQVINLFDLPEVTLFGTFTLTKLSDYRAYELSFSHFFENLGNIFRVMLSYDNFNFNSNRRFWTLYPISIPFVLIGAARLVLCAVRSFRRRAFDAAVPVLAWALFVILGCAVVGSGEERIEPNIYRTNGAMFALAACAVAGFYTAAGWLRGKWKRVGAAALAAAYAGWAFGFFAWYFTRQGRLTGFMNVPEQAVAYVEGSEELRGRPVYALNYDAVMLLAMRASPYDYNLPEHAPGEPYRNYVFQFAFEQPYDPDAVYMADSLYFSYNPDVAQALMEAGMAPVEIDGTTIYFAE